MSLDALTALCVAELVRTIGCWFSTGMVVCMRWSSGTGVAASCSRMRLISSLTTFVGSTWAVTVKLRRSEAPFRGGADCWAGAIEIVVGASLVASRRLTLAIVRRGSFKASEKFTAWVPFSAASRSPVTVATSTKIRGDAIRLLDAGPDPNAQRPPIPGLLGGGCGVVGPADGDADAQPALSTIRKSSVNWRRLASRIGSDGQVWKVAPFSSVEQ